MTAVGFVEVSEAELVSVAGWTAAGCFAVCLESGFQMGYPSVKELCFERERPVRFGMYSVFSRYLSLKVRLLEKNDRKA